ncbi:efflux RND transporter permease subunit [Phycisphaeraceae bacterium D3-23]
MLKSLIKFSIDYALFVLLAAVLLVGFAMYRLPKMPVDVFPELNAPTVVVMTEAGGLSADEVEQYVTFPIETAVNGVTGVRRVRSASAIGLSIVWIDLDWGEDLYRARQLVSERLDAVRESLPEETHAEITPVTSIAGEIMLVSLSSPDGTVSDLELRSYAEFELRNKLLAVPGVAQCVAIGGELPEYQVHVDPDRLRLYDLTTQEVIDAASQAHSTASAGYLPNVQSRELPMRQQTRVQEVGDIENTIVAYHNGAPVTIGQVADVQLGPALKRGTGSENGHRAVVLSVQKSPGVNTLELTDEIDALFSQLESTGLPEGIVLNRDVVRQSHFINRSVSNVRKILLEAVVIIAVIIILFLLNVRTTLITLTAMPVSVAVALLLTDLMGWGINVMTLGGLAVAVGVIVDDAIIDVENVFRRLKQNQHRPEAQRVNRLRVIYDASNEIRPAMVFATLIIVMVFIPLLFLQGLEGRFFRPLGLMYVTSIIASLIVALTVTPAMCRLLLKGKLGGDKHEDGFLVRFIKRLYTPMIEKALTLRWAILLVAALATAGSLWLGSTFGSSFLPTFNEGTFTVFLIAPPGTSLDESDRMATGVERRMSEIEGVKSVVRRTGRAERDEHAEPVNSSEIEVALLDGADKDTVRAQIDRILGDVPGVTPMVGQPIEHRLSHMLSGTPDAIAINVYGNDLDELRKIAKEVEQALAELPGARDVRANREVMVTTLPIVYRPDDLQAVGLTPGEAAKQVRQALFGETVATVNQDVRQYELVVRLDPALRQEIDDIRELMLISPTGQRVRLREVADLGPQEASNLISRENAQRKAVISLNVAEGHNLGDLVAQVKEKVDPIIQERPGYIVSYGGQFEAQQSASKTILLTGLGVAVLMLMMLQVSTGSFRAGLLVMVNMPLALIGGIVAVFLTEGGGAIDNTLALLHLGGRVYEAPVISIASLVGFITLFGIAVRNGILLVNHYQHLMVEEGKTLREAVVQGSTERLVPILMTAISAALGLVPMAMALGQPGGELLAPLAVVVLGGLLTSTFLNLVVVPAGFYMIFKAKPEAAAAAKNTTDWAAEPLPAAAP